MVDKKEYWEAEYLTPAGLVQWLHLTGDLSLKVVLEQIEAEVDGLAFAVRHVTEYTLISKGSLARTLEEVDDE